ncbi:glycosyltransferase [Thioalkalivibrio sp. ALMg13-2]|uniref:glycosyltransferase n=1 Tax=Thioalkalivibrio sp. ALMg13-2 TaxID=1158167 RepID=UPI00056F14C1|nr:glycosyltransferase [Thioalkalivibrio sp. ALMg13-2]
MSSNSRPIALFIPALNGGGAQRVVVNLANALVDLTGRPIHVVLVRAEGEFLADVRPEVCIRDLGKKRTLAAIPALASYLRSERPAVLMARMNYVNIAASVAWMIAGRPCRLVLSEANVVQAPEGSWSRRVRQEMVLKVMRAIYPAADCVVANSEATAQSMSVNGVASEGSPIVIHNPVLGSEVGRREDSSSLFDGFRSHRVLICAIGRLAEQKGFDCLLKAFSKLHDQDAELVILGEGPLRGKLQEQARQLGVSERVHLPGFVGDPMHVLERSSLFVLSSRWEGFGNVLVEALASGVPVVSTDCPGAPRALLRDGALGHLVPVDEPDALAQAITEALHSPRGTREARQDRARDFSAPEIARQYLEEAFGLEAPARPPSQES